MIKNFINKRKQTLIDIFNSSIVIILLCIGFEFGFYHSTHNNYKIIIYNHPIVLIYFIIISFIFYIGSKFIKFGSTLNIDLDNEIFEKINELTETLNKKDKELFISERKYRNLFNDSLDLIFIINSDLIIYDFNDKAAKILNMDLNHLNYNFLDVVEIIDIKGLEYCRRREDKLIFFNEKISNFLNDIPVIFECVILNKISNIKISFEILFNKIDIEHEIFIQVLMRDITFRKELENELELNKDKFEYYLKLMFSIADNIDDLLWAKDINGKYLFGNKAICIKLLGIENPYNVIGKTDVELALAAREKYKHDFGEMCFNSDNVVIQTLKPETFHEYGNALGKWLDLEVIKSPLFDRKGVLQGTVGVGRDITNRLALQKELEKIEQNYKLLFDLASDAMILIKEDQIYNVNKKALELFGYTYDEFKLLDLNSIISNEFEKDKKLYENNKSYYDCIKCSCSNYNPICCSKSIYWKHKRKDDTIFNSEINSNKIILSNEEYILIIIRDITERVIYEEKISNLKKLYEETIDAMPSMVYAVDKNYNVILYNKNFIDFMERYNLSIENIVDKNLFEILKIENEQDIIEIKKQFDYVFKTGNKISSFKNKIVLNDKEFVYNVERIPIRNGKITGVLTIFKTDK